MTKFRMDITALPDSREEALRLYDALVDTGEEVKVSSVRLGETDLWQVGFETELGDDDRTIEQLQEFLDKMKAAVGKVGSTVSD